MNMRLLAPLLIAVIFLTGCGGFRPKNAEAPRGVSSSTVVDGVRVQASLPTSTLDLANPKAVSVTVTNEGAQPVSFLKYNGCDTGVQVSLEQGGQRLGWFRVEGPPMACTEALEMAALAPGAKIQGQYVWVAEPNAKRLAAGEYLVTVRFNRADGYEDVRAIAVELQVNVSQGTADK